MTSDDHASYFETSGSSNWGWYVAITVPDGTAGWIEHQLAKLSLDLGKVMSRARDTLKEIQLGDHLVARSPEMRTLLD